MAAVSMDLPAEAFSALRLSPEEMARQMRLAAAIYWYARGMVSQERAAAIAGLDRADFLLALAAAKIDAFHVNVDELRREVSSLG